MKALFVFRKALATSAAKALQGDEKRDSPMEISADFMEEATRAALVAAPSGAAVFVIKILSDELPKRETLTASLKEELIGGADKLSLTKAKELVAELGWQAFGASDAVEAEQRLTRDMEGSFGNMGGAAEYQLTSLFITLNSLGVKTGDFRAFDL